MSNNLELKLRRRVMLRIYLEYTKSLLVKYSDYFMGAIFLVSFFMMVSLKNVFTNMPKGDFGQIFNFLLLAFKDTDWLLQILLAGLLIRLVGGLILTRQQMKKVHLHTAALS